MNKEYSQSIARHYCAYRPPLHKMILERVIGGAQHFGNGLDIGCGTGYSAVALANYCAHVFGVDSSKSMLEKSTQHDKITYLEGSAHALPLPDTSVDIVTLAGSLFYVKSIMLVRELKRVCRKRALIIPYDFEVILDTYLKQWDIKIPDSGIQYDHKVNLSDIEDCIEHTVTIEEISLAVSSTELAHILLSSCERYDAFAQRFHIEDPFDALVNSLAKAQNEKPQLQVIIYFSKYSLSV